MFCIRCGRPNRDDANYCACCGADMGSLPPAQQPQSAPGSRRPLWIAGLVVAIVVVSMVMSLAVCAWALRPGDSDGYVYVDGCIVVGADGEPIELVQNPEATDVTWAELKEFLANDRTDRIKYDYDTFVCADFAESLHNNAERAGIRAGYVCIDFAGEEVSHACNVFETTDRGIIYVDDTGTIDGSLNADTTVDLAVGHTYCPVSIFSNPGYEDEWDCMGRVSEFSVTW